MKVLALIPCRGGSVRLPQKNTLPFCGMPLVWWTVLAARLAHDVIDKTAMSTNDQQLLELACSWHVDPIRRPDHLSRGVTRPIENVQHALRTLFERNGYRPDAVLYLQPTSPLRTVADIRGALNLLWESDGDAVVSSVEASEQWAYEVGHAGRLRFMRSSGGLIVNPNGAIFAIKTSAVEAGFDFWNGVTYNYLMPKDRSIDIDVRGDFELAQEIKFRQLREQGHCG